MAHRTAAFLSYARFDDQHDDGLVSRLRERLSAEVRVQTGEAFPIFQDRNDIAWGQHWQARIDEELDASTLLLAVVTPGFFHSTACRAEVERFREREKKLGRDDLILPLYYVSAPHLDDPEHADDLGRLLRSRQLTDWRELRFEPMTSPVVRRAIAQLAERIRDGFALPRRSPTGARISGPAAAGVPSAAAPATSTVRAEPPTHVVDAWGRGDFLTIRSAVRAAEAGDRILVRPGLYTEAVVIDKPLEILGDGPRDDIVLQAADTDVLTFRATVGRVANLTIRQLGGGEKMGAVWIRQGRLDLTGCDLVSRAGSAVYITGQADPRIRDNRIHDAFEAGVWVSDGGLGTLEDNDITANAHAGVGISDGGNPTLRRNTIRLNGGPGLDVHDGGKGTVVGNDLTSNATGALDIAAADRPNVILSGNREHAEP